MMPENGLKQADAAGAGPAIFRRLWESHNLGEDDMAALAALGWTRRHIPAHGRIESEDGLSLLSSGLAFRQRIPEGPGRRLISLVLPGDICCYACITGHRSSASSLVAVTACTVMHAPIEEVIELCEAHPNVLAAILSNFSVDGAVTEELLLSIGHRSAIERMAHFFCELEFRLGRMRLSDNAQYLLNMTQADIGDYLALSAVHVNRTLQELRRRGLVRSCGPRINLLDPAELQRVAGFSPAYLRDVH